MGAMQAGHSYDGCPFKTGFLLMPEVVKKKETSITSKDATVNPAQYRLVSEMKNSIARDFKNDQPVKGIASKKNDGRNKGIFARALILLTEG